MQDPFALFQQSGLLDRSLLLEHEKKIIMIAKNLTVI
jgi:hypothetical protein